MTDPKPQRLAKAMADAGLCSRREAERWIGAGRVTVNGAKILTPACLVGPADAVEVDGKMIAEKAPPRLWLYHKPKGLITTNRDPEGRPTVFDKLPPDLPRVLSVGRLDLTSEGLLLLTNDGALARRLELPSSGLPRTYRVRLFGEPGGTALAQLKKGITVEGVRYGPIEAELEPGGGSNRWLKVTLHEGKNREIRRVFEHLGFPVNRLIRIGYGPFNLGNMAPGSLQELATSRLKAFLKKLPGNSASG